MNKYQKILNLLAINSNTEYKIKSKGQGTFRVKFEGNDTILFYEADNVKPDSKKVIDFKNGTYSTYENINWQDQSKEPEWRLFRKFFILDFQHIADGLPECPFDEVNNPYINKKTKLTTETAYVDYIHKKPNESMVNGFRRVWVNPKLDIAKQVKLAGKLINGYARYFITQTEVKKNVDAFNKAKTFNFKTKFNLYVTPANEDFANYLAPKEFFNSFKEILISLGYSYIWKEVKGEDIYKFNKNKGSIYAMIDMLNNWYHKGYLNEKQTQFFLTLPCLAKEYPFLVSPSKKVLNELEARSKEEAKKISCDVKDRKLLDILSQNMLEENNRFSSFNIYFSKDRLFISYSVEQYDSKTKKWNKPSGFTISPVTAQQMSLSFLMLFASIVALSNHPYLDIFMNKMINYLDVISSSLPKDNYLFFKEIFKQMIDKNNSYSFYFKVKDPKFKNKIFYIKNMPKFIFDENVNKKYLSKIQKLNEKEIDISKAIPVPYFEVRKYFEK